MHLPDEPAESTTTDELKDAFAALKGHETDILHLLRSVADSLALCPELGSSHPLAVKWDGIRQECRQLMQRSRRGAFKCATLLSQCMNTLPAMLRRDFPLQTRQSLFDKFMKAAEQGMATGDELQKGYWNLSEKIREFPNEMKAWESSRGFWERLWSTLKDLASKARELIDRTSTLAVTVCVALLKDMGCGGLKSPEFYWQRSLRNKQRNGLGATMRITGYECADLRCRLLDVHDFWEAIYTACDELKMLADLAETLKKASPESEQKVRDLLAQHMKQCRELAKPITEILHAYSRNSRHSGREF